MADETPEQAAPAPVTPPPQPAPPTPQKVRPAPPEVIDNDLEEDTSLDEISERLLDRWGGDDEVSQDDDAGDSGYSDSGYAEDS